MNIALIGFGKMGQAISKIADKDVVLKLIVDPGIYSLHDVPLNVEKSKKIQDVDDIVMQDIDVFIEFTSPEQAKDNIIEILRKKPGSRIVCGTTGWNTKEVDSEVKKHQGILLFSANFSIGINSIVSMLPAFIEKINDAKGFEASLVEYHHKNKKDSPSGTGKCLADIVEKSGMTCQISSVRAGSYPGTHIISFDSKDETIQIIHEARSRDVFATGAIYASKWLNNCNVPGQYSLSDIN